MVDIRYNSCLSNLFNSSVIKEFAFASNSKYFEETIRRSQIIKQIPKNFRLGEVYDFIFAYLLRHYRSEYVYKNTLALKILLGRHSLNTSSLLTELRVGYSKADVVILNGTSSVYEIKTEFDNLDRLKEQLDSYLKMFEYVYVVSHKSHISKIKEIIDKQVGILELSKSCNFHQVRPALSNKKNVDPRLIFDSFRKSEYIQAIKIAYGIVPNLPNTQLFKECRKLFSKLKPSEAHDIMLSILSKRMKKKELLDINNAIPKSLVHSWLASTLKTNERINLIKILNTEYSVS